MIIIAKISIKKEKEKVGQCCKVTGHVPNPAKQI